MRANFLFCHTNISKCSVQSSKPVRLLPGITFFMSPVFRSLDNRGRMETAGNGIRIYSSFSGILNRPLVRWGNTIALQTTRDGIPFKGRALKPAPHKGSKKF